MPETRSFQSKSLIAAMGLGTALLCSSCQTLEGGFSLDIIEEIFHNSDSPSVAEPVPPISEGSLGIGDQESAGTTSGNSAMSESERKAIIGALEEAALGAERQHRYENAAAHYRRLNELNPLDIHAALGVARNLRYIGSSKKAVLFLKASSLLEDNTLVHLELVKAQIASGLVVDAEKNLVEIEKVAAENWELYALKGLVHDHMGRFLSAQQLYNRALEISPQNISVLNNLSISLAQSGKLDEAILLLNALVNSEYSNPQLRQNLALFYGLKGDFETASELAREDLPPEMVARNLAAFRMIQE